MATEAPHETVAERPEPREVFRQCERFLGGHGVTSPRDVLAELAATTGSDEEADRYGGGTLIEEFEREVAGLLGKEAAVFLPSGTMAQAIALRIWSDRRGSGTVVFHPTCHLEIHEQKGYQMLHGLHGLLVGNPHELITLGDLESIAEPASTLLLELPQREIGGLLPSWDELTAQTAWARERGISLHMDGARLWEAGPFYGRSYAEISALFDSVYVSFYKGVGAIAGAVLAGPTDFIAGARIWIRRHGGNLIHLYPYVISARENLRRRLERFPHYHERAVAIARVLNNIPGIVIAPDPPQANMMHVYLRGDREALLQASVDIAREHRLALFSTLRPTQLPGHSMFELSIGDAADSVGDHEIDTLFRQIMAAGERHEAGA